ncbi:MAG: glycosyltransferase [Cyanobacteriota bacterium]|nr:glycosyltransferase [Cyanobacteriota bacterium]
MRVLHVIPSISPLRGGPSQAIVSMVGALRYQGIDARILTTNDHGSTIQKEMPLRCWHTQCRHGHEIPVLAFPRWNAPVHALREFCISDEFIHWLTRFSDDYDLVHVHALFSFTTSIAMVRLRHLGKPYILRTIGQLNSWSLTQSPHRKQLFLSLFDQANILGAAALHFTSDFERSESERLSGSTYSFVLPLGVEAEDIREPSLIAAAFHDHRSKPLSFLFLSRLHPKKQLPLLFEALQLLKKNNPGRSWQLDVAGDGNSSYLDSLKVISHSLGISDQIRWHGHVSGEAKAALLRESDWFVLPSLSENFGISVVEALKLGLPVILTPGVAVAADVEKYRAGFVCEPTVEALSSCLERCLVPPEPAMKAAAKQLAEERYTWGSISKNLIVEYERAIGN